MQGYALVGSAMHMAGSIAPPSSAGPPSASQPLSSAAVPHRIASTPAVTPASQVLVFVKVWAVHTKAKHFAGMHLTKPS